MQLTKEKIGDRKKVDIQALLDGAVGHINQAFSKMGWDKARVTDAAFSKLKLQPVELICLRLYTGPCFMLYNGVLRSKSSGGIVPTWGGPLAGLDTRDRFTTTIHAINSGVIKLSRLQPACPIFRGVANMKLPQSFSIPNALNIRAGVECESLALID